MSPTLQAQLLRFLPEKQFERLGEGRTRRVDVRVVAAMNRDLELRVMASVPTLEEAAHVLGIDASKDGASSVHLRLRRLPAPLRSPRFQAPAEALPENTVTSRAWTP